MRLWRLFSEQPQTEDKRAMCVCVWGGGQHTLCTAGAGMGLGLGHAQGTLVRRLQNVS